MASAASYGVFESNPIDKGYHNIDRSIEVDWGDKRLARVTRLRLLSDPGFPYWDVSYCHGELKDGTPCRVQLPFNQLPKRNMKGAILKEAIREKVYAKGLGILDDGVISKLC